MAARRTYDLTENNGKIGDCEQSKSKLTSCFPFYIAMFSKEIENTFSVFLLSYTFVVHVFYLLNKGSSKGHLLHHTERH